MDLKNPPYYTLRLVNDEVPIGPWRKVVSADGHIVYFFNEDTGFLIPPSAVLVASPRPEVPRD